MKEKFFFLESSSSFVIVCETWLPSSSHVNLSSKQPNSCRFSYFPLEQASQPLKHLHDQLFANDNHPKPFICRWNDSTCHPSAIFRLLWKMTSFTHPCTALRDSEDISAPTSDLLCCESAEPFDWSYRWSKTRLSVNEIGSHVTSSTRLTFIGMATRFALAERSCFGWISTPVTTGLDVTKFDAGHWRSRRKVL